MAKFGEFLFGEAKFGSGLEGYSLRVTPDLGWPSIEAMFSIPRNPRMMEWELDELEVVLDIPTNVKNSNTLFFEWEGSYFKVPAADAHRLGANGKHLWRIELEPIMSFIFVRNAAAPVLGSRQARSVYTV